MRVLLQRVSAARVIVDHSIIAEITHGLLGYVGVCAGDTAQDAEFLAGKTRYLRIFADAAGKTNLDVSQVGGAILLVSNFTLAADTSQGRRPAFTTAAPPAEAESLFELLCRTLRDAGLSVQTGRFAAKMLIESTNNGPMNFILDSRVK